MFEHTNHVKMKVDTSTPLRNDFKPICQENVQLPAAENVERDTRDGILCAKDANEESSCTSFLNLDKSAELFPCSPIPPENIPQTLLPLLDTPDYRWSDSMLTPFMLDKQNETPSQFVRPRILSDDEELGIESPAGTSSFQMYSDETLVDEFVLHKRTNSTQLSPIIQNKLKTQSKNPKSIHKKLFPLPEEDTSIVSGDDYSYQRMGDVTLNDMERICQISESLFTNSGTTKSFVIKPTDDGMDFDMNMTDQSFEVLFEGDGSIRKRKFTYPYNFIKTPKNPLRVDEVIETVFSFEGNEDVCHRKSYMIPRAMVSFNELRNRENSELIFDDRYRFVSSSENSKLNFETLITIVLHRKDIYYTLRSFFDVCRINFARTKNVNCSSITSRLTTICERRDFISRLHEELSVLKKKIRFRLLKQFIGFFQYHFHLVYNFFDLKKRKFCINFDFSRDKIKSTTFLERELSVDNSKLNVTVFQAESLAAAQQLLADVQDSDFEIEYSEVNLFGTKVDTSDSSTNVSHALECKVSEELMNRKKKPMSSLNSLSSGLYRKLSESCSNKFTEDDAIVLKLESNLRVTRPSFEEVNRPSVVQISSFPSTKAGTSVMYSQISLKSSSSSTESDEGNFVGFQTARGQNIKIEEQALKRGEAIFQDIGMSSVDEIVPMNLFEKELNPLKRTLQMMSPQRALESKRIKSDKEKNLDCANKRIFSTENSSGEADRMIGECDTVKKIEDDVESSSSDSCVRRSISPELSSNSSSTSARRSKLPKIDFMTDEALSKVTTKIRANDEAGGEVANFELRKTEELSLDDDSIQAAFESSFSLETDQHISIPSYNESDAREIRLKSLPVKTSKIITGFNTAGGHELKVPESALKKVENLFQDIDEDIFAQVPEDLFSVPHCSSIAANISSSKNNKSELRKVDASKIVVGFSTAAGNELSASKAALEKAQKFVESVDHDLGMETIPWPILSDIGSDSMVSAANCGDEPKSAFKMDIFDPPKMLAGFSTAAGSELKVSKSALKSAQKLFQNIDSELPKEKFSSKCPDITRTSSENERNKGSRTNAAFIAADFDTKAKRRTDLNKFNEFTEARAQTAPQEDPSVSPEIILNSRITSANRRKLPKIALVDDEEDVDFLNYIKMSEKFPETTRKDSKIPTTASKTARNLFENVAQESLKQVHSSLHSELISESSLVPVKTAGIDCFKNVATKTTADLKLDSTKSALKHTSEKLQKSFVSDRGNLSESAERGSTSLKTDLSSETFSKDRFNFKIDEGNVDILNPLKISVGFSTASGNKLRVPKSSLEKSWKLFESLDDGLIAERYSSPLSPKNNASSSRDLSASKYGNKLVKFDTADIDLDCVLGSKSEAQKTTKYPESVTANSSGKHLAWPPPLEMPSVNQSEVFRNPSENDAKNEQTFNASKILVGFNTASGNKLSVPHSALERAQKLFKNIDDDFIPNVENLKQQAARHDENQLSKISSAAVEPEFTPASLQRSVSPEINPSSRISLSTRPKLSCLTFESEEDNRSKVSNRFGASNRGDSNVLTKVQVLSTNVSDSLSNRSSISKSSFVKAEDDSPKMSVCFSTAAGNKVNFSQSALMRAQKLFQNVNDDLVEENSQQNWPTVEKELQKVDTHECTFRPSTNIPNEMNISEIYTEQEKKLSDCGSSEEGLSNSGFTGKSSIISTESTQDQTDFSSNEAGCPIPEGTMERKSDDSPRKKFVEGASSTVLENSSRHNSITNVSGQSSSENQIKVTPPERSRPSSPVFETRKFNYPKRRHKRRSQTSGITLNVTPLNVTYSGRDNENKSSPEDILRKIKDNFSSRSNKRKESISSMPCPLPKRPKELQSTGGCNVPEVDRRPRCGSYLSNRTNGERITLRQATNGLRPRRHTANQLIQLGVIPSVVGVDAKNAGQFIFSSEFLNSEISKNTYGDDCRIVPNENNEVRFDDLARGFLSSPGVDRKLISEKWIRNHYRWIVWKLAAFEKSYPHLFARKYLTLDNVLYQLKYRYDREIDRCERSVLKRILEGDDSPHKPMILCVASVRPVSGAFNEFELELSDGWYSILSQLDIDMCKLIARNRIVVGSKLIIMNAELVGLSEGCDPLEVNNTIRLKISTNCSRLVRWDTRLGYHSSPSVPVVSDLKTILPDGGVIYPILAVIARVYPLLFLEKRGDGYSELYNEKMELKKAANFDRERQACYEHLASTIIHEVEHENSTMNDSDEYLKIGMNADIVALQNRRIADQEKMNLLIKERIELKLPDKFRDRRKIVRLLKMRIVNDSLENKRESPSAIVTIWNPSEDTVSLLKEGKSYHFHNLNANDMRNQELRLSSNRATRYESSSTLPKSTHHERRYTPISELKLDHVSLFNEIDTVGIVIDSKHDLNQHTIYLADLKKTIVAVKFVLDIKDYGFEEILKHKRIVAAINLQWKRGQLRGRVPLTTVTEYTTFTQKSRYQHLQSRIDEFGLYFKIQSLDEFVEECEKKLKSIFESQFPAATSTPVKFISSRVTAANCSNVSNTSDSSMDTSSGCERSNKSRDAQSRIDRLRQYGEPPPLSPITLSSGMNVRRRRSRLSIQTLSFKSNDSKS